MHIVLHDRTFEPPLPYMSGSLIPLVVSPGVRHRERLENPTDRLASLGPQQEVKMVAHQAVAEKAERIPFPSRRDGFEKRNMVFVVAEDGSTIIAAIDRVIHQSVIDNTW
jgi:hypothetical protein